MDFISSYIKIKPTVANVLLNDFETRDDDNLLLLKIWDIQSLGKIQRYEDFKKMLLSGKLALPDSVTRCRRKLQEHNVGLRGKTYEARKSQEKLVSQQTKMDFE